VLTYDFRLPPGPRTVEYALLAEALGFRAVWCPEIPAFGHDIWITLARIAEKTKRIKFGPSVLIPMFATFHCIAKRASTIRRIHPAGTALLARPGGPTLTGCGSFKCPLSEPFDGLTRSDLGRIAPLPLAWS
jgi:hypothetical protein